MKSKGSKTTTRIVEWLPERQYRPERTLVGFWANDVAKRCERLPPNYNSTYQKHFEDVRKLSDSPAEKRKLVGRTWMSNQDKSARLFTDSYADPITTSYVTTYDISINKSVDRLTAGADKSYSLFRRPIPPAGVPYYWRPEPPTNWGLLEEKRKEWNEKPNMQTEPSVYQQDYLWYGKETPFRVEKHGVSVQPSGEENLTVKDWDQRGKDDQLLPIPWKPPQPRYPGPLASTAVAKPEEDRCQETGQRFAARQSQPLHPVEKWAANTFLG